MSRKRNVTMFGGVGRGVKGSAGTYVYDRDGNARKVSENASVADQAGRLNVDRAVMWTELPRAINPVGKTWKKWKKVGAVQFPIFDGDSDRRKYQQMSRDVGEPRAWVK